MSTDLSNYTGENNFIITEISDGQNYSISSMASLCHVHKSCLTAVLLCGKSYIKFSLRFAFCL